MQLGDYTSRLEGRCRNLGLPVLRPDDAEKLALSAIQQLANSEAFDECRSQFQKSYTVPVTTGLAGLASLTDLLVDHIDGSSLVHSDGTRIDLLPPSANSSHLMKPRNSFAYYAVRRSNRLEIRKGNTQTVPDGTITFDGEYSPSLLNLPDQFQDDIVELSVGLLQTRMQDGEAVA